MEELETTRNRVRLADATSLLARKEKQPGEDGIKDSLLSVPIPREERRATNHRSEDRLPGLIERAILHYCYDDHEVEVVNLSSGGAMIACAVTPWIGDKVELTFEDQSRFRCLVRWVRDGRIGLEFGEDDILLGRSEAQQFVMRLARARDQRLADGVEQRDRPRRHNLLRAGAIQTDSGGAPVRIKNVSREGALIEGTFELLPGAEVRLDLSGLGYVPAEIRWTDGRQAGVKFAHEIDLEPVFARTEPTPEQVPQMLVPDYLKDESNSPWANRWATLSMTELKPVGKAA